MILSTRRLVQKMENQGEDWIWHVGIYSTCWINCKNSMKNGKQRLILDMSSWNTLHMQGTSYLIVLIFECTYNMEMHGNEQIYHICKLDRRNCTLYSRKRMLGWGQVSEGYPRVKSIILAVHCRIPAQSLEIIGQISPSLRRFLSLEKRMQPSL